MVHCRSYIAADVGLHLKKKYGIKFFFDMRGFWADEKKDGTWNIRNPVFKYVYKYYKSKEAEYLKHADYIIALTEAGKREMMTWPAYNPSIPVSVIPCCADMDLFFLTDNNQKSQSRIKLGILDDRLVISYLGSVGTWYMLDEMLEFFKQLKQKYTEAVFLFVTHSDHTSIRKRIGELELNQEDFLLMQVARKDVPAVIKASDINISFIKPVYSKISSSPTKLGEVLSMGIPVICNSGVGDVKEIVNNADAGFIIDGFTSKDFDRAINAVPSLLEKSPAAIRHSVKNVFDLENGVALYKASYKQVLL
jgi:glycosyltransferase involved in cell wall biosynthesis